LRRDAQRQAGTAELIDRIMADAEILIRDRLVGLLGHGATPAAKVA
jgi:hypothetical protein